MRVKIRRGASVLDPIPVGVRADGEIAHVVIVRKEGGVHCLVTGMNGSGKTWGERPVLLSCGVLQADQILMDPVKGVQSYSSIAGCLQMYEVDPGRCRQLIRRLLNHTLPARTNQLAREGLTEWSPRSSLRFLRIHIEEAWKLANAEELVGLGVALRSAGGQLTISLQQPTWDQMPTVLRNQMGVFRCYGLADRDYAEYSLPEDVVAAGANPAKWGNDDPGMHYLVGPKMTMKQKTLPVRSFDDGSGPNTFAAAAEYVAAQLGPMCSVTAASLGDLWTTHVRPLQLVKQMGVIIPGPVTTAALTNVTEVDQPRPDQDDDLDVEVIHDPDDPDFKAALEEFYDDELDVDAYRVTTTEAESAITLCAEDGTDEFTIEMTEDDVGLADPDEPMHPVVARMIGDPPKDGVSPEEFRQLVDALVEEFLASDRDRLERSEFINIAGDCGWSPQSFYKYLNRDPRITKADRGWIRVQQSELAA